MSKTYKIVRNLVSHTFDPELRAKVWQWLVDPANEKEKDDALLSLWNDYPPGADATTYRSLKATREKIKGIRPVQKRYSRLYKLSKVAAIFLIPLLSAAGAYVYIERNTYNPELIQCFVPEGEKRELLLPDGSTVNINSGSTLIYPEAFKGSTRTLYLTGEANFSVRKDKKHPFIVSTSYLKVQALGTKFNVQAYPGSDKITTTLENGAVRVNKIGENENSILLSPNEQLEYNYKTGIFEKRMIHAANYSGWIKGELNFINMPLKEMLAVIQRKYVVDFVINPRLFTSDLYTIKFPPQEDIHTVMRILTTTVHGLVYEIDDHTITIYPKK